MSIIISLLIAFISGGAIGYLIAALMIVSTSKTDEEREEYNDRDNNK